MALRLCWCHCSSFLHIYCTQQYTNTKSRQAQIFLLFRLKPSFKELKLPCSLLNPTPYAGTYDITQCLHSNLCQLFPWHFCIQSYKISAYSLPIVRCTKQQTLWHLKLSFSHSLTGSNKKTTNRVQACLRTTSALVTTAGVSPLECDLAAI